MSDFHVHVSYGATMNDTAPEASIDIEDEASQNAEFERFETLAAKVVQVPKAELDAQRES